LIFKRRIMYRELKETDIYYNKIHKTKEFGKFIVTHVKDFGGGNKYKAKFIESGNIVYTSKKAIDNLTIKDKRQYEDHEFIGKKFQSNEYNDFTIIRKTEKKKGKDVLYEIEFDEVNFVRFRCTARKNNIINGRVKNPYYPFIYNIGYLGEFKEKHHSIYNLWKLMLKRCYDTTCKYYKYYGAKGVYVDKEWLCFSNFQKDYIKMNEGKTEVIKHLDKDIICNELGINRKVYSKNTCKLITKSENSKECRERDRQYYFEATDLNGNKYISNNQTKFAKDHNISFHIINRSLNLKTKSNKDGWVFRKLTQEEMDNLKKENKDMEKLDF